MHFKKDSEAWFPSRWVLVVVILVVLILVVVLIVIVVTFVVNPSLQRRVACISKRAVMRASQTGGLWTLACTLHRQDSISRNMKHVNLR